MRGTSVSRTAALALIALAALTSCGQSAPTYAFDQLRAPGPQARGMQSLAPQMFFTPSGDLYLLDGVKNAKDATRLQLRVSHDGGDTFGQAIDVTPATVSPMLAGEMSPQFGYDPQRLRMYVLYDAYVHGAEQLLLTGTYVFGKHFPPAVSVVPKRTPSANSYATLGLAPNGDVYVAWLDERRDPANMTDTAALYVTRSQNGGKSFEPPVRVANSACPCCRPSLAFGDDGSAYVAWRQVYPGSIRDIDVARAGPDMRFSPQTRVNSDGWSIAGCPDSGPRLLVSKRTLYVAWFTLGTQGIPQVRVSWSTDRGATFAKEQTISNGVDDANHPAWVIGARTATLVWEGRSRDGSAVSNLRPFFTRIVNGNISRPTALPARDSIADPVAASSDATSFYVAASAFQGAVAHVELVRVRILEPVEASF